MRTQVLIVEAQESLGKLWQSFLERQGFKVALVGNQLDATDKLRFDHWDVLVIDLMLPNASALAISDFASYKNPDISIIVVSASSFFSDGSIFELLPNARGFMNQPIEPDDLAAVVDHCTRPSNPDRAVPSS
ncbi:MAG: response regulator [Proteobacteria bacterium]|nr:response regulator [Pseudomonadota bacterium]